MGKNRLFWRLFISYLAIITVTLSFITWYGIKLTRDFFIKEISIDLNERNLLVKSVIHKQLDQKNYVKIDSLVKEFGFRSNTRFTVILRDGKVVGDTRKNPKVMENHINRPEIQQAIAQDKGMSMRYSNTLQLEMMYVAIPIKDMRGTIQAFIRSAVTTTTINSAFAIIELRILIAGILTALVIAVISIVISRRISYPLEIIQKGIEKFAKGSLDYRVDPPKIREFNKLAKSLNDMADQLSEKINFINEQKSEKQTILESMIEGVIAVDKNENLISMNHAAASLFHVDADKSVGTNIVEITGNSDLKDIVTKTLKFGESIEQEVFLRNGRDYFLKIQSTTLKDSQDNTIGALVVLHDVTKIRRLENIRRDFVANVSHEIKTPLTSIKGYVETLIDGALDEPINAKNFLKTIAKQADRLNAIIEDLLTLSRLEQEEEQKAIEFKLHLVINVVRNAIHTCAQAANYKNIAIYNLCDPKLEIKVSAPLMEQAVINLIDNAIKYSPADSKIQIETEINWKEVIIKVRDEGPGIQNKHLPRLFERFYRVDKARSRNLGGTGLGLAIVKHIAQVHGGRVDVESQIGKGSTFFIHLPYIKRSENKIHHG